jgi:hypothetical protein
MISRSFGTTGLYHRDFEFENDLAYVSQLTGRFKEILLVQIQRSMIEILI